MGEHWKILERLFEPELIKRIRDVQSPLKHELVSAGFRVLQFPYSATSAIVVEHADLPGFVIKFARDPGAAARGRFKPQLQMIKRRNLETRAINANRLQDFIQKHHIRHVRVPQKFFFRLQEDFPVILAEKVSLESRRGLADLNAKEIQEVIAVVEFAKGTLDLWPRNMIIGKDQILFIDLEREQEPTLWVAIIMESIREFRNQIQPEFRPIVEQWFARVAHQNANLLDVAENPKAKRHKLLKLAVQNEDLPGAEELLKEYLNELQFVDKLLFIAVQSRNAEVVKLLLSHGANPHKINEEGYTATDIAARLGETELVALFEETKGIKR